MEVEAVSETLDYKSILTQLIGREKLRHSNGDEKNSLSMLVSSYAKELSTAIGLWPNTFQKESGS